MASPVPIDMDDYVMDGQEDEGLNVTTNRRPCSWILWPI
jgi:hypothetical protein